LTVKKLPFSNKVKFKKMKKFKIIAFILPILFFSNCDLNVIDDPNGITPEKVGDGKGPLFLLAGALKSGFEGHNQICWSAGLVGNEELASISANISQTPIQIETQGKVPADLGQNTNQASLVYSSLALSTNARKAIEASSYNPATKALFLANANLIEGMMYGDWAKFYEKCYEFGVGKELTPDQARDLAISKLQEAIKQFAAYNNATDLGGVVATGLFTNSELGTKFCNSFIGMLYFDTGAKSKAAEFLQKGYVKADLGKELGYKNSNALTSGADAIYSAVVSGTQFQLNQHSVSLRADRILSDTFRRFPATWGNPQISLADNITKMNYFYPAAPGTALPTIPATSRLPFYPIITANEVALMLVDAGVVPAVTFAQRQQTISDVLTSWKMPAAVVTTLSTDPSITLERVARYEYVGRGRRWAAAAKYAKWPVANEFSFR
jgi:hypothetical protein